jgi:hypothetical protein
MQQSDEWAMLCPRVFSSPDKCTHVPVHVAHRVDKMKSKRHNKQLRITFIPYFRKAMTIALVLFIGMLLYLSMDIAMQD